LTNKYANLEENRHDSTVVSKGSRGISFLNFDFQWAKNGPLVQLKMGKKDKTVPENNTAAGHGETFVSHLFLG
jgi:hypothetical protein